MAQVTITLKISLDEANLIMKLLDEGEFQRNERGKAMRQIDTNNATNPEWRLLGQETLVIQALRRGIQGANR